VGDEGACFGEEFMIYLEKKILSRLNVLARHKKVPDKQNLIHIGIKRYREGGINFW